MAYALDLSAGVPHGARTVQKQIADEIDPRRLSLAIKTGEVAPAFQPIIDLTTGEIVSCEVLARWTDASHGSISPDIFVPLAEKSGLLDQLMISLLSPVADAMKQCPPAITFAINVSPSQLRDPWFAVRLISYMLRLGIPAQRLMVEITESVLIKDFMAINATLKSLRSQGVRIALDDFGTGYSNLQYLCSIDCDVIKVDRCFVEGLQNGGTSRKVLTAVAGLSAALGLSITAEGIETEEQARQLSDLGCARGQGFLFSRPVPASKFVQTFNEPSSKDRESAAVA